MRKFQPGDGVTLNHKFFEDAFAGVHPNVTAQARMNLPDYGVVKEVHDAGELAELSGHSQWLKLEGSDSAVSGAFYDEEAVHASQDPEGSGRILGALRDLEQNDASPLTLIMSWHTEDGPATPKIEPHSNVCSAILSLAQYVKDAPPNAKLRATVYEKKSQRVLLMVDEILSVQEALQLLGQ